MTDILSTDTLTMEKNQSRTKHKIMDRLMKDRFTSLLKTTEMDLFPIPVYKKQRRNLWFVFFTVVKHTDNKTLL